jgi:hypothetical protein
MIAEAGSHYDHHRGSQPLLRPTGTSRTAFFVAIDLAGFIVVNAFWRYLSTGQWLDLSFAAYRQDMATPLADMLLQPLSVFSHPWMILIQALLLSVIIFVPIILAVLLRLAVAGSFVAVVALVGHAPLLAVSLALACMLAARTPLRSDMPFLASLLALVPVGLYLYFGASMRGDSATAMPLQRLVLAAPLVGAVVAAVLAFATVLWLANLTDYRPGVVWPAMVVLLAAPLVTFYTQIGPAELDYSLVAGRLAPGDALFEPVAMETWSRQNHCEGLNRRTLQIRVRDDVRRSQQELIERCDAFLSRHGDSARAPAVLWVSAQARNLHLDASALEVGLVKYSASFPQPSSADTWRRLINDFPSSPQGALARWRLGVLSIRGGDVKEGFNLLEASLGALKPLLPTPGASRTDEVFSPSQSAPAGRYYEEAAFDIGKLLWVIQTNGVLDEEPAAEALAAYLNVNPLESDCLVRVEKLAGTYEHTSLGDYLKLAVAMNTPNVYERAEMLIVLADRGKEGAAVEANHELGRLAMRTSEAPALPLVEKLRSPEEYFRQVAAAGESPWETIAKANLAMLRTPQGSAKP